MAVSLEHSLASKVKMEDTFGSDTLAFCKVAPVVVLKKRRLEVIE
jgi:hypothetical protein